MREKTLSILFIMLLRYRKGDDRYEYESVFRKTNEARRFI